MQSQYIMCWKNNFMAIFLLKPLVVGKISLFLGIQNDALMHREGLKGQSSGPV